VLKRGVDACYILGYRRLREGGAARENKGECDQGGDRDSTHVGLWGSMGV